MSNKSTQESYDYLGYDYKDRIPTNLSPNSRSGFIAIVEKPVHGAVRNGDWIVVVTQLEMIMKEPEIIE